jgi:NAD(P)-dependent dehydrogenase (short-subunit alcohol dehydrogenase family)
MRLQNKTALITGGNSGIGLATARLFVAEGAQVVITGRDRETLDAAARELGSNVLAVRADVKESGAPEAAVASALERFGRLDIVFANAGIGGSTPLGQTTVETFERFLSTNLTAVFFTIQAAAPHLEPGASIVLNGSVHAVLGIPGASAYAASKAGIRAMTRVLAAELAERGIRVNVVVPGATRTPIWDSRAPTPEAFAALEVNMLRAIPLGRLAEAEDIAKTVLFLSSDDAAHITAAEIVVDGGNTGAPGGVPIYRAPK